ncbi:hypothetical protein HG531_001453 [Fusarium graminearum]|nr:hypothetical protein HG531_001453 [Fusarium graminearum]
MCEGIFGLEFWYISAPLRNERVELKCHSVGISSLKGFCVRNMSFNAFNLLLHRPPAGLLDQALMKRNCLAPLSPIEKLPLELISSIYLYLHPTDCIALGLCSQTLWIRAMDFIRHSRRSTTWVDTPIFIASGKQLLALREASHNNESELQDPQDGTQDAVCMLMKPQRPHLFNVLKQARSQNQLCDYASLNSSDINPPYLQELIRLSPTSGISKGFHRLMESCLFPEEFGGQGQWCLRDFTTNEYIRMEPVRDRSISEHPTISLTRNPWMTLDILLIWLITWEAGRNRSPENVTREILRDQINKIMSNHGAGVTASDVTQIRSYSTDMSSGRWAGHSLDVVQLVHNKMESGWTDITDEIQDASQRWFVAIYYDAVRLGQTKYVEYWRRFAIGQMNK